jgi:hypothetical protein
MRNSAFRPIGVSPEGLRAFVESQTATLPVAKLQALARELFGGHAVYDPETDTLQAASRTASTSYTAPPSFTPGPSNHDAISAAQAPRMVLSEQAKPAKRQGWLGNHRCKVYGEGKATAVPRVEDVPS